MSDQQKTILAIDPGTTQSAYCLYTLGSSTPVGRFAVCQNDDMREVVKSTCVDLMVVEMVASYGKPVGREVFQTCVWIGRFAECWYHSWHHKLAASGVAGGVAFLYRHEIKMALCHATAKINDAVIRQRLLDLMSERYGVEAKTLKGTKANPGPLYGLSKDVWAALAVAVAWEEERKLADARSDDRPEV